MKKILFFGCIFLVVVCAPKKTVIQTEGLEEVVVFGEETKSPTVSTEPVLPVEEPMPAPPPVVEPAEEPMAPAEEELVLIPPPITEEPIVQPPPLEEPYVPAQPEPPVSTPQTIYGFRVQIFASNTEENATRVAEDARGAFNDRVYIEYVAPYYKVRIGDYLTREDIEPVKNKALSLGYRGAFIVETMVTP
ncbi:MAG: SPOR domain-containing protein [candidate division WOR-3 bacterium]|nr:MAG: SPOR domain-containing protein [candidate division WOR-3 bacterium]